MPLPLRLPRFRKGQTELQADDLNRIVDAINSLSLSAGHGIHVRQTPSGTIVSRKDPPPTEGGGGTVMTLWVVANGVPEQVDFLIQESEE